MHLLEFMSLTLNNWIHDTGWNLSLKNGIPTLCKGLQSNQSPSPYHPPKQTNKLNGRLDE